MSVDRPGNVLACPRCLSPEYLGEFVTGWRELREPPRMVDGEIKATYYGEVYDAERTAFFCSNQGCNVDEEIRPSRLVQLDRGGKPVVTPPAEQGRLDAA